MWLQKPRTCIDLAQNAGSISLVEEKAEAFQCPLNADTILPTMASDPICDRSSPLPPPYSHTG